MFIKTTNVRILKTRRAVQACQPYHRRSRLLKGVAREKWGRDDALRAQWPLNEVAKATAGSGLLRTSSDEFPPKY